MTPKLSNFAEIIAKANDQFMDKHKLVNTLMGIIDKALRNQGIPADAITIDAVELDKKIVFLLPDALPEAVEVALGNRLGDINKKFQFKLDELDIETVITIFENYFLTDS